MVPVQTTDNPGVAIGHCTKYVNEHHDVLHADVDPGEGFSDKKYGALVGDFENSPIQENFM